MSLTPALPAVWAACTQQQWMHALWERPCVLPTAGLPCTSLTDALLPAVRAGMMSMAAAEQQKKEEGSAPAAAHSPLEPVVISRGFAASVFKH